MRRLTSPLEEPLPLPTEWVEGGDAGGRKGKIVGVEDSRCAACSVEEAHASQAFWIVLPAALFQRLGVKRQPSNLRDLQSELSHARGDLLVLVAVGVAPPLACPLVGRGSQKLRSLHSHRQVEEFFQHLAKGLGSFFDQLLQDLS